MKGTSEREARNRGQDFLSRAQLALPRFLRRPARLVAALVSGRTAMPPHIGTVAAVLFFGATGLYGMQIGGHAPFVAETLSSTAGFALEDVHIAGNSETSDITVLEQIGLNGATSVLSISVEEARQRLIELPWVVDAQVTKVYPDSLSVKLVERVAVAIWQHGETLSLIDARGDAIVPLSGSRHAGLPLYVGLGANRHADELEARLIFHPELKGRVKAAIRVADRRWDLRLDNGVTIRLPERDVDEAFARFADFDAGRGVADRDIAAIDLRVADRVTLRLTETALARRQDALEARDKAIKAGQI
ncbi:cell division protein FtsQ/DivIB [Pseudohoeflea coraliihabitans]|uniref:Cell division protein FtsQ n=1 Tax=Pseudohoeflea coraliihabitans TaxID=2860393 RepID=A0ABS6WIZ7_9HYPH|nr:cell division protein FtsQ/DivIB [Pseudohoeflea sp. DP4N28-3]MBW3095916.1 cell division protein FtsQ/DivIB [Pseudohoeflea sp. DP4N28-3]